MRRERQNTNDFLIVVGGALVSAISALVPIVAFIGLWIALP